MKQGVICLGEALIDFIPLDNENLTFQKSPGGAPANVAVGIAKLGAKSTFVGKVGEDVLGTFLKETLTNYQVDTSHMLMTEEYRTSVTFVTLTENGERSFDFFIDQSADQFLKAEEIDRGLFKSNKILHFGSISMIKQPAKEATKKAVELAKQEGMIISYDPNLRLDLWKSTSEAKETMISMLDQVDVLKISEEELEFMTGERDIQTGIKKMQTYDIPLVFITLGGEGCIVVVNGQQITIPAIKVHAVDTTGAGDAFVSAILYKLNEYEGKITELTQTDIEEIASFGIVSGGLVTAEKGAMTALPTLEQIEKFMKKEGRRADV